MMVVSTTSQSLGRTTLMVCQMASRKGDVGSRTMLDPEVQAIVPVNGVTSTVQNHANVWISRAVRIACEDLGPIHRQIRPGRRRQRRWCGRPWWVVVDQIEGRGYRMHEG